MKKMLINILLFCGAISLTACSTNTQKENTAIGTVSGAVVGGLAGSLVGGGAGKVLAVGVGAVAGALVGGSIGHSMDHSDHATAAAAMSQSPSNKATTWTNSKTGMTYTFVPTSKVMRYKHYHYCRKYYTTMTTANGQSEKVYGIACRNSKGYWHAVR